MLCQYVFYILSGIVWNIAQFIFLIFMTESGKKNQKLVEAAFEKIEETAFSGISEEEQKRFMQTFEKIYKNLNAK